MGCGGVLYVCSSILLFFLESPRRADSMQGEMVRCNMIGTDFDAKSGGIFKVWSKVF